jgi:hypothetical protein
MKRLLVLAAVASLWVAALPASSMAAASVSISIGDPYRGTALHFRSEPDVVLVPETRVYYVRNYDRDVYRYGRYWYFVDDGRWYRARTYRGPFLYVHQTSVPRAIVSVPPRYRRHWGGPPPHAVARGYHKQGDVKQDMWKENGRDKHSVAVRDEGGKKRGKGHK